MTEATGRVEQVPPLTAPPGVLPRPQATALAVLRDWLGPLEGRSILDAGCGVGALAASLVKLGAVVTGVDPQPEIIAEARARVPSARFAAYGAQEMAFDDASFDAVVLLNSFHHVPVALMHDALRTCARVSRGPVLIIEPLCEGSFFACMKPVDDETSIRTAAQMALEAGAQAGEVSVLAVGEYDDVRHYADADAFLARVVQVDPARAEIAARERDKVVELVARHGERTENGLVLRQPHRAHLLTRGPR